LRRKPHTHTHTKAKKCCELFEQIYYILDHFLEALDPTKGKLNSRTSVSDSFF